MKVLFTSDQRGSRALICSHFKRLAFMSSHQAARFCPKNLNKSHNYANYGNSVIHVHVILVNPNSWGEKNNCVTLAGSQWKRWQSWACWGERRQGKANDQHILYCHYLRHGFKKKILSLVLALICVFSNPQPLVLALSDFPREGL